jgi:putative peptidoglycan lipid II flippase
VLAEAVLLRRALGGFETRETLTAIVKMVLAAGVLAGVTYAVWAGLDALLGQSLIAQIVAVFTALGLGTAVYVGVVLALRIPEARQIVDLFTRRLRKRS